MEQFVLTVPDTFPEIVKFASKVRNISLPEVAKKSGISYPTVHNIVHGKPAEFKSMSKVAKVLGIKISFTLEQ